MRVCSPLAVLEETQPINSPPRTRKQAFVEAVHERLRSSGTDILPLDARIPREREGAVRARLEALGVALPEDELRVSDILGALVTDLDGDGRLDLDIGVLHELRLVSSVDQVVEASTPTPLAQALQVQVMAVGQAEPIAEPELDLVDEIIRNPKPGDVGKIYQELKASRPGALASPLAPTEQSYLEIFSGPEVPEAIRLRPPYDPTKLTEAEQREARERYGSGDDAFVKYANAENRHLLVKHYVLTHPATVRAQLGLFRLVRDANPIHFAFERGWQMASGKESLTDEEVSRLGAAAEFFGALALVYGSQRLLARIRPQTGADPSYQVDPHVMPTDALPSRTGGAPVLGRGGYVSNSTSQPLSGLLRATRQGNVSFRGLGGAKRLDGDFMFVVDEQGQIMIGTRAGRRMPHPTLIGGDPTVRGAGIVRFRAGKIVGVDNASGHFKPGPQAMEAIQQAFSRFPSSAFGEGFIGYNRVVMAGGPRWVRTLPATLPNVEANPPDGEGR